MVSHGEYLKLGKLGSFFVFQLIVLLPIFAGTAQAQNNYLPFAAIEDSTQVLRMHGRYSEARDLTERFLAKMNEDPKAKPYEIVSLRVLNETMAMAASFSETDQAAFSEADSLELLIEELFERSQLDEARSAIEKRIGVCDRLFPPDHPEVASSYYYLARLEKELGQYAEAEIIYQRTLTIFEAALGEDHPDVAMNLNDIAFVYRAQGHYAQAQPLYERALSILEAALGPDHSQVAILMNNFGLLYAMQGLYAECEPYFIRSLEINEKNLGPDSLSVANSLNNLGMLYMTLGHYAKATPCFERSLTIFNKLLGPEHPSVAVITNNLALLYDNLGDYSQAEQYYIQSREIWKKSLGPDHPNIGASLNNQANLYRKLGNYPKAEIQARQSLELREQALGPDHPSVAESMNTIAIVLIARGNYSPALPLLLRSIAIKEKALGPDHPAVAVGMQNLAELYRFLGQLADSAQLYEQSLELIQQIYGPNHPDLAIVLSNYATLCKAQKRYEKAETLYRRALPIMEETYGVDNIEYAVTTVALADLHQVQGRYDEAESLCKFAENIFEENLEPDNPIVTSNMCRLAEIYAEQGLPLHAIALYHRALALAENSVDPISPYIVPALVDFARCQMAVGHADSAVILLTRAARRFESARLRIDKGLGRSTFQRSPYPALAAAFLGCDQVDNAWPAVEKSNGRTLADLLFSAKQRPLTEEETAKESNLSIVVQNLENQLDALQNTALNDSTGVTGQEMASVRLRLLEASAELSELSYDLAEKYPLSEGQSYSLQEVQNALGDETAIVGWLDVRIKEDLYHSWGYVLRNRGPVNWVKLPEPAIDTSSSPLEHAQLCYESLTDPTASIDNIAAISTTRVQPLLPMLAEIQDLILIPTGVMAKIPLEGLVDEHGRFLLGRFSISYIPSATVYTWLHQKDSEWEASTVRAATSCKAMLLGDPPFSIDHQTELSTEETPLKMATATLDDQVVLREAGAGNLEAIAELPRLSGTRDEVQAIARISSEPTLLLGLNASEQILTQMAIGGDLANFRTIHLATHAIADPDRPERSCLILSQVDLPDPLEAAKRGERIYDGRLTAKEILEEWQLSANLVTLSACETGLGRRVHGEGMVGFAHAFLQAGARSLLVSLWKVDDQATSLLMTRFYENLWDKKMSKAQALSEAKRWLSQYQNTLGSRPYEHPYFWSAFVLVGDRN